LLPSPSSWSCATAALQKEEATAATPSPSSLHSSAAKQSKKKEKKKATVTKEKKTLEEGDVSCRHLLRCFVATQQNTKKAMVLLPSPSS
jgi:hypothetical protein